MKNILEKIPYLRYAYKYRKNSSHHQPGHFYSAIMNIDEVSQQRNELWRDNQSLDGIDLYDQAQLKLLSEFAAYKPSNVIAAEKVADARFYYNNPAFPKADAFALYCMLLHYKPKRIIEVGSGFSSGLMMDINEKALNNKVDLTFIEPYPDYALYKVLFPADKHKVTVHKSFLQQIPVDTFEKLEENDILFIDNSHVSKTGSDVNYVFFEILPRLRKGVLIHIHDIFYPFIYPQDWIFEHRLNWNEIYLLRAFLTYNNAFETRFFVHYLQAKYPDLLTDLLGTDISSPGGSFWMQKMV